MPFRLGPIDARIICSRRQKKVWRSTGNFFFAASVAQRRGRVREGDAAVRSGCSKQASRAEQRNAAPGPLLVCKIYRAYPKPTTARACAVVIDRELEKEKAIHAALHQQAGSLCCK